MTKSIGHGAIVCSALDYGRTGAIGEFAWLETANSRSFSSLKNLRTLDDAALPPTFGYLFEGQGIAEDPDAFEKLGRVGAAMVTDRGIVGPKGLPAILTYFGQFIDHDITLNTDADPANLPEFSVSNVDGSLTKNSRAKVVETIRNGRVASLRLDSLYGDTKAIESFLRDGAKMKIGQTTTGRPNDLPRMIDLPKDSGIEEDPKAPLVGDSRNDENLVVAQLHLAFLRFHNAIVDTLDHGMSEQEQFLEAKRLTIFVYQWLVLNEYCDAIIEPAILSEATTAPFAQVYRSFSQGRQMMPLEFSVAVFRFGHSMIRPEYHFNRNFGPDGQIARAPLSELFRFTGGGGLAGANRLSDLWVIDWVNFLPPDDEQRAARGIDSTIADGLAELVVPGEEQFPANVRDALKHLPARNLRRSYVLSIPTAQQILTVMNRSVDIEPLSEQDLLSFADGIIGTEGLLNQTPLWLYILLEAEIQEDGNRLGQLGSFIVAQTLIGLLAEDKKSILNNGPDSDTTWHPDQEPIGGEVIDSLAKMLGFAGVL